MRYLLLDRISALQPPALAQGIKCVTLSEDLFLDHFPGYPIFPGALQIEALAQLGGVLVEATLRERGRADLHALLTMVDRARFRRMVRPGDRLELEARGMSASEDGGRVRGVARVGGEVTAEAELTFAFAVVRSPRLLQQRRDVLNLWLHGAVEDPQGGGA